MASMWWREVWQIINNGKTSTGRTRDGMRTINTNSFKSLSMDKQQAVNGIIEEYQLSHVRRVLGTPDTLNDIKQRAAKIFPMVINNFGSGEMAKRVRDSMMSRDITPNSSNNNAGISNMSTMAGVYGQDPSLNNRVNPNIWISPMEAAAIYSQKGLPETIIRKKSQSILLNGVKIKCKMLSAEQNDKIADSTLATGLAYKIAEVAANSLTHGGGLLYPTFKKDSPASMGMSITELAKAGIIGKGCIDFYTAIDRWNVVHIPNWNPTSKDFLLPDHYYVPFLGCDVKGARCARVITAPQSGYWGALMTLGWGISDIPGWIESVYNYYNVMAAVPNMINQMSILARTFNVDGLMATEGASIMEAIDFDETIRVRQASINNPINMDVIGDLKAIDRDFAQVPELIRLVRQDAAARATIPEELLWSSERGAFSSGDSSDSAYEKQSEGTRYIHVDVAHQLKAISQLAVINALGLDRDVIAALPYVTISFDNPRVTNAKDKADIGAKITKGFFDLVAGGLPEDVALDISRQFSDDEFAVDPKIMDQVRERQKIKDERETEKHEKDMAMLDKQIETEGQTAAAPAASGGKPKPKDKSAGPKAPGEKEGHSYSDPLKQKQHEKVGAGKKQGVQKAQAKVQ
jgi:hypothetical protein